MNVDRLQSLRIVAMVLAGGRVGELSVLTLGRPKAALPFAGYYRIIDFPLSNLMRAGINNVGILSQYRPASLIDHIGTGESWDFTGLDRGAKILPPFLGGRASDWYRGNADAVYQNLNYIQDLGADLVLILSADHIYSMDYRDLIQFHMERGADMTVAFKKMERDPRYGYGRLDSDGRLLEYEEKPAKPETDLASLTIYLVKPDVLIEALSADSSDSGVKLWNFGRDVIPSMIDRYRLYGYEFDGYWAYTRTLEAYHSAHQDLISGKIDIDQWGVRTNLHDTLVAAQPPARMGPNASIGDSLISTGCEINGTVIRSVLSPGVRVEEGARVVDSILCHGVCVREGAQITRTISDKKTLIESGARIGGEALTVLGKSSKVGRDAVIEAGTAIQPDEEVPGGKRVEAVR